MPFPIMHVYIYIAINRGISHLKTSMGDMQTDKARHDVLPAIWGGGTSVKRLSLLP